MWQVGIISALHINHIEDIIFIINACEEGLVFELDHLSDLVFYLHIFCYQTHLHFPYIAWSHLLRPQKHYIPLPLSVLSHFAALRTPSVASTLGIYPPILHFCFHLRRDIQRKTEIIKQIQFTDSRVLIKSSILFLNNSHFGDNTMH